MSESTIIGALVAGLLSLGITDAKAGTTASQLSRACAEYPSKTDRSVLCLSYISGVLDAYRTLNQLVPPRGRLFCITSSATPQAIIPVVRDDLLRHPEKLSMQAASVVLDAISDTFPCN
jgi:Rap1a immunity proteins